MIRARGRLNEIGGDADEAAGRTNGTEFEPVEISTWIDCHLDALLEEVQCEADASADDEVFFRAGHISETYPLPLTCQSFLTTDVGNKTNPEKWDALQRLAFIEAAAFWRGWITRADLEERFGISLSQISADFKAYLNLNPHGLRYDLSAKRYWGAQRMTMKVGSPDLRAAIGLFLGHEAKDGAGGDRFATIDLPARTVDPSIARDLFRAVAQNLRIEIHYFALTSARAHWRWISPHAFAHDGYRWHVRAYCHEDNCYKDFVLGRVAESHAPVVQEIKLPRDSEWDTWDKIRLKPHRELDAVQRRAIELDYNMRNGAIELRVRRSMRDYTLAYLGVRVDPSTPRQLELDGRA